MHPKLKTAIEIVISEAIRTRKLNEGQIKSFFSSERLRKRILSGVDEMLTEEEKQRSLPTMGQDSQMD